MASEAFIGSVYLPIASRTEITSAEVYAVTRDFLSQGTSADPVLMWESGTMKIVGYSSGGTVYAKFKKSDGTEGSNSLSATVGYYGVAAWTVQIGGTTYLRVGCCGASSIDGIVSYIRTDSGLVNILYSDTLENAKQNGLIGIFREWDEAPTSDPNDPNNEDPRGGGYADVDPFDETDIMSLSGLPDPDTWDLDYGNLICPYSLNATMMQKIGASLFMANFWTDLRNKFTGLSDPLSFILDAVELPISIPDDTGISRFRVGGELVKDSEGNTIGCANYTHRYYKWSMGSITLKEVWGTALDYSDTSISIFLPYVGVKDVDTDIVLNCTTTLYLYMDVWNGDILYLLHASNANSASKYFKSESVVYRWSGNCGKKLPLGRVDQTTPLMTAAGNLAGLAAGFAIGGPAGAGMAAGATFLSQGLKTASHGFTPTVQTSGGIAGSVGRMDYHNAYYIIKRSVPEYPNNWRQEFGAPRYQEFLLSSMHGYTEFAEIHADDVNGASDAEKKLIEQQLMQGVILP